MYPKNACTEIKSRSRNADAEAEKAEAGSPLKCKTQRLAATVEAAGTVSGDQPLVEAKENSKYKTQRLAATEAARTVSGDQPLADVARETPHKENSKYDTPKLTDTGNIPLVSTLRLERENCRGYLKATVPLNVVPIDDKVVRCMISEEYLRETRPYGDYTRYNYEITFTAGTDASQTSYIKSRSQMVLARIN